MKELMDESWFDVFGKRMRFSVFVHHQRDHTFHSLNHFEVWHALGELFSPFACEKRPFEFPTEEESKIRVIK